MTTTTAIRVDTSLRSAIEAAARDAGASVNTYVQHVLAGAIGVDAGPADDVPTTAAERKRAHQLEGAELFDARVAWRNACLRARRLRPAPGDADLLAWYRAEHAERAAKFRWSRASHGAA